LPIYQQPFSKLFLSSLSGCVTTLFDLSLHP
jgi:hypothetical protein